MHYRAVQNRCAVDLGSINLPIEPEESIEILKSLGCECEIVDIVQIARRLIGNARYERGVSFGAAPKIVDCSSLIKWLYGQKGIWLPRLCVQQCSYGLDVERNEICPGDVLFTPGFVHFSNPDFTEGIGHAALATKEGTVIHAASRKVGLIEEPLN